MKIIRKAKLFFKETPYIWLALFYPAFAIAFFALEAYIPSAEGCWIVQSPLDNAIPFIEIFVIPYIMWYPFLALTPIAMLVVHDAEGFKKHLYFMIISFGAALVFCFFVPNAQPLRPEVMPRDNFFTKIIAELYKADTPTNVFPSMHVIGSIAGAAACLNCEKLRKLRAVWIIPAVLISLSTVFIKQHSIIDVFGAIAVCVPLWIWLYGGRERKKSHENREKNIRRLHPEADGDHKTE